MIKNVRVPITAPCPGDDLVLVSLEHDDGGIFKGGTADRGVRIIGHVLEVTEHDMVCDDIGQCAGVLSNVVGCVRD